MKRWNTSIVVAAALGAGACSKQTKATVPTASVPTEAAEATPTPPPVTPAANAQVGVSDEVARACELRFSNLEETPKFAYDDFELLPQDRTVLEQIARCLTQGPLKGKSISLVGRADPRGTEEYNLGLGARRAEMVGTYLQRLGVPGGQMTRTTRGDIDAAGIDETGWRQDRRVDLELRP